MKSINELGDLMIELIEAVNEARKGGEEIIFIPRAVEIVKEIAAYSKATKTYQQHVQQCAAKFWANPHTAADVWLFMLDRIVNAPSELYRDAAVLWHMPTLEKAIEEAEA